MVGLALLIISAVVSGNPSIAGDKFIIAAPATLGSGSVSLRRCGVSSLMDFGSRKGIKV